MEWSGVEWRAEKEHSHDIAPNVAITPSLFLQLPDKHGIAANGKYYGKVDCSSQIDQVDGIYHDKDKFVDKDGKGWTYNGDRQKPYWAERKGRYRDGYSKAKGRRRTVGWD